MMRASFKKKSLVRSVSKPKQGSAKTTKPDSPLRDAEQFLLPTYKRPPVVMTHGRGAFVFDSTGKKYLDFLGGIAVNALGHAHPRIVKVIRREAARAIQDRKSTRLNSSHQIISYAVFCLKKKKTAT